MESQETDQAETLSEHLRDLSAIQQTWSEGVSSSLDGAFEVFASDLLARAAYFERLALLDAGTISLVIGAASTLISRQTKPYSLHAYVLFLGLSILLFSILSCLSYSLTAISSAGIYRQVGKARQSAMVENQFNRAYKAVCARYGVPLDEGDTLKVDSEPLPRFDGKRLDLLGRVAVASSMLGFVVLLWVFCSGLLTASQYVPGTAGR